MWKWIGLLARLVVGGVWLWAGLIKIPHPEASVTAVRAYQLLPLDLVPFVGRVLPIVEVLVGALLLLGFLTRFSGLVSALLQIGFIIGIASVWARGIAIECGCFGDGGAVAWETARAKYPWEIARDVGLLALSAYLVWRPRTPYSVDNVVFPEQVRIEDVEVGSTQ